MRAGAAGGKTVAGGRRVGREGNDALTRVCGRHAGGTGECFLATGGRQDCRLVSPALHPLRDGSGRESPVLFRGWSLHLFCLRAVAKRQAPRGGARPPRGRLTLRLPMQAREPDKREWWWLRGGEFTSGRVRRDPGDNPFLSPCPLMSSRERGGGRGRTGGPQSPLLTFEAVRFAAFQGGLAKHRLQRNAYCSSLGDGARRGRERKRGSHGPASHPQEGQRPRGACLQRGKGSTLAQPPPAPPEGDGAGAGGAAAAAAAAAPAREPAGSLAAPRRRSPATGEGCARLILGPRLRPRSRRTQRCSHRQRHWEAQAPQNPREPRKKKREREE